MFYSFSQLLERKKSQSVEDASQSIECLCHIMTTVGSKLDTDKAKVRLNAVFMEITLTDNWSEEQISSTTFNCRVQNLMLIDTIKHFFTNKITEKKMENKHIQMKINRLFQEELHSACVVQSYLFSVPHSYWLTSTDLFLQL